MHSRVVAISMLLCAPASPAWCLEGIVRLQDGQPLPFATVAILGQAGSTRTDAEGRFTWVPDPMPVFQIIVVRPGGGYSPPVTISALPADGSPLVVKLGETWQESITIEAGATPFTEMPPAAAATVLTAQDLALRRPDSLTDGIQGVPGVGRLEEAHSAVPSVRGLARGRTLLLVDGARVTAERRAGPSATYLDPIVLDSVEIARGYGSLAYGSDSFGGVINARTRSVAPDAPWGGRIEGTYGAGSGERAGTFEVSKGVGTGGFLFRGHYRNTLDYDSPEGAVEGSSYRDGGGFARWDGRWGSGQFFATLGVDGGRDIGKPVTNIDSAFAFYPREDSTRVTFGYDADPEGSIIRWTAQGFVDYYRLVTERDRFASATSGATVGIADVRANDYGARLSIAGDLHGWRLEGGLDLNGRLDLQADTTDKVYDLTGALVSRTEDEAIEDADRHDAALYISTEGRLSPRITISGGARGDYVTARNDGGFAGDDSTTHGALSGFAGFTFGPFTGITITAQAGRGFRDPTLSDRYFHGVSGRGLVTGNPDLDPETSLQYELSVRRTGRVRWGLYGYVYNIDDLIERFSVGTDFFFRNRNSARIQGAELEMQVPINERWSVEAGASTASGHVQDDGSALDDIPADALQVTLRRLIGAGRSVMVRGIAVAPDHDPGPTEERLAGYGTFDAGATWRFTQLFEGRLVVRNILDHDYQQTADSKAVLAPGRTILMTVAATF